MRLSKNKIGYLAHRVLKMVQEHPRIHIIANEDLLLRAVDDAIYDNMHEEDEIDEQVESLIKQNVNEIRAMDMDVGALRNKMKRELARKRNFTL
ncbi:MAG: DUF507 family protein [bacterium]|nr:DUF507 family protein [bacterium]